MSAPSPCQNCSVATPVPGTTSLLTKSYSRRAILSPPASGNPYAATPSRVTPRHATADPNRRGVDCFLSLPLELRGVCRADLLVSVGRLLTCVVVYALCRRVPVTATIGGPRRAGCLAPGRPSLVAHQSDHRLGVLRIPALLTIDCDAVLQFLLTLVVTFEVHLISRMVSVADDPEKGELIGALGGSLGGLPCSSVQPGLGTTKGHGVEVPETLGWRGWRRHRGRGRCRALRHRRGRLGPAWGGADQQCCRHGRDQQS